MKKGFEIQFTWIFVIIAGAIIFAFLVSIVGKQKEQAQLKDDVRIKEALANIITISSSSSNAVNSHEYAPTTITFMCDEPDTSGFRVGTKGAMQSLATSVVFAQKEMKGGQFNTWTLDWDLPYKAATFTYITNKRTRYIFYKPSANADGVKIINWLLESFPTDFEKVVVETTTDLDAELVSKGYDAYVIVQVDYSDPNFKIKNGNPQQRVTDANSPNEATQRNAFVNVDQRFIRRGSGEKFKSNKEQTYLITIYPDNTNNHFGTLDFVKNGPYHGEHGISYYYGREMLLGAVFAPQKNLYQCAIRKAFDRASLISKINYERVATLDASATTVGEPLYDTKPQCQYLYGYIKGTFNNESYPFCGNVRIFDYITAELAKENGDPTTGSSNSYAASCTGTCQTSDCANNIFQRLEDNNNRLVREARDISLQGGCPYVY
jgi:hypothetical protein